MKIDEILIERRAGGDDNPRVSAYKQLEKHKDDDSIYISFVEVDKIGINPQSQYDTPLGVYAYPLKAIWQEFDHDTGKIVVPFAGSKPYIYVIRANQPLQSVTDYDQQRLDQDIEKLTTVVYRDLVQARDNISGDIKDALETGRDGAKSQDPFVIMWNTSRRMSMLYNKKDMVKWNYLLRKLGYSGFVDHGEGIIHEGEPISSVFLTATAFKSVDKIRNVDNQPMSRKRADQIARYAYKLVINNKPIPSNIMDLILTAPHAYSQLARTYSVQKAIAVPDEIIEQTLKDDWNESNVVDLYTNFQSRKNIPYPPRMIQYLNAHEPLLAKLTKQFARFGSHLPPEIVEAVLKRGIEPTLTVALNSVRKGHWPLKPIHDRIMNLGDRSAVRAHYLREIKDQGLDIEHYREPSY